MKTHRIALCLTVASWLVSTPALAYQLWTCPWGTHQRWGGNSVMLAGEETTLSADDIAAIQEAMAAWNQSGADFTFSYTTEHQTGFDKGNLRNEIARAVDNPSLGDSPAVAVYTYETQVSCVMLEADIYIDGRPGNNIRRTSKKSESEAYGGSVRPLTGLMIHELGHVLGLHHSPYTYSIMGDERTCVNANGDTLTFDPGADATEGAAALYGAKYSVFDVRASQWQRTGTLDTNNDGFQDGVYSAHGRIPVLSDQGVELPKQDAGADPRYKVRAGATIKVGFTYESLGPLVVQPGVGFYLAKDDAANGSIDASDRLLAQTSLTLGWFGHTVQWQTLQIPTDALTYATPGRNSVLGPLLTLASDARPGNNATYVRLYIMDNGDDDYCTNQLCKLGEGKCTDSSQCVAGTTCLQNAGGSFGLASNLSVCASFCSSSAPCQTGQGHCSSDSECATGLVCSQGVGAKYGFGAGVNVCEMAADLVVTSLTHSPSAPTDLTPITFTAVVKNQGGVAAPTSVVRITIGSETVGQLVTIGALAPGASATVQRVATLSPGTYSYRAAADVRNTVPEASETNNERTSTVTVVPAMPDLVVSSLTSSPSYPAAGGVVTVTAIVKNAGSVAASATSLYISGACKKIASIPALGPGQSAAAVTCSFTSSSTPTTYTVTATADSLNNVAESSETNNSASRTITTHGL